MIKGKRKKKQAGAELCQALAKLGLSDSWGELIESYIQVWL
jgi:hypothetical protein